MRSYEVKEGEGSPVVKWPILTFPNRFFLSKDVSHANFPLSRPFQFLLSSRALLKRVDCINSYLNLNHYRLLPSCEACYCNKWSWTVMVGQDHTSNGFG